MYIPCILSYGGTWCWGISSTVLYINWIEDKLLNKPILLPRSLRTIAFASICLLVIQFPFKIPSILRSLRHRTIEGNFVFKKTWKDTYAHYFSTNGKPALLHQPLKIAGIYSHALYQSWMCRNINMVERCKGCKHFNVFIVNRSFSYSLTRRLPSW